MICARTAEHVSDGHPDKFCDQVADRILDEALSLCGEDLDARRRIRTAIECLAKDNLLIVSGETKWPAEIRSQLDVIELARECWLKIGYSTNGEELSVIDHIRAQSPHIAEGAGTGTDFGGAGDQGIMVGYATSETPEMMPKEYILARDICMRLRDLRRSGELGWLRSDTKTQVTINPDGQPTDFIVAAQHDEPENCGLNQEQIREQIFENIVKPILGDDIPANLSKINGTGLFVIGGPTGDAGVVGRKIVVDQFGPRVPVGGGAFSGKDATKVDRSAAYMARHIAKNAVKHLDLKECTVHIAYGIGQLQPEMVTAVTETGDDVTGWVKDKFPDLSPGKIIDHLCLLKPEGWSYFESASYGHYGREQFPWERILDV